MRIIVLLLLLLSLLAIAGCRSAAKVQELPRPDHKPAAPTREMLF